MTNKQMLVSYETVANQLKFDWKKINSKELVIKAQNNVDDKDMYDKLIAAIICRFFSRITYLYRKYALANHLKMDELQDIYIDSILSLVKQNYVDEFVYKNDVIVKNPLFADNGVNIALITITKTKTLLYIQHRKCDVRCVNYNSSNISLDDGDDNGNNFSNMFGEDNLISNLKNDLIYEWVIRAFNDFNYQLFFILDGILNADCFSDTSKFKIYTLSNHLNSIDDDYLKNISDVYNLDFDKLSIAYQCTGFANMNQDQVRWKILNYFRNIKSDWVSE